MNRHSGSSHVPQACDGQFRDSILKSREGYDNFILIDTWDVPLEYSLISTFP